MFLYQLTNMDNYMIDKEIKIQENADALEVQKVEIEEKIFFLLQQQSMFDLAERRMNLNVFILQRRREANEKDGLSEEMLDTLFPLVK